MASSTPVSLPAARFIADATVNSAAPAQPAAASVVRPGAAYPATSGASQLPPDASPDMTAAVNELVDVLKTTSIGLRFEIDEDTHRVITKVIDKDTGELIRQLPSEEVLRFAKAIDKLQGLFVSHAV